MIYPFSRFSSETIFFLSTHKPESWLSSFSKPVSLFLFNKEKVSKASIAERLCQQGDIFVGFELESLETWKIENNMTWGLTLCWTSLSTPILY